MELVLSDKMETASGVRLCNTFPSKYFMFRTFVYIFVIDRQEADLVTIPY
jgi:hypothetical protein